MSNRTILFMWLCFWLLYLLHPSAWKTRTIPVADLLGAQRNETWMTGNVTWPVNATRFGEIEDKLDDLRDAVKEWDSPVYWRNVTAMFKGDYRFYNLTSHSRPFHPSYNATKAKEDLGSFDYSSHGAVTFDLRSNHTVSTDTRYITGTARLNPGKNIWWTGGELALSLHGVHFVGNGSVVMIGVAQGNPVYLQDVVMTMRTNESFVEAQKALFGVSQEYERELEERLKDDRKAEMEVSSTTPDMACKFRVFMQLIPAPHRVVETDLYELEQELQSSTGISTIPPPPLISRAYIYSPECGVFHEMDHLTGLKVEQYYQKIRTYAVLMLLIAATQLYLTARQMDYTATHSALSKVSVITMGVQTTVDVYLCFLHLTTSLIIGELFLPLVTAAFLQFILFSLFEMRYLLTVTRAQRRGDEEALGTIYTRFYAYVFVGLFIFYQLASKFTFLILAMQFVIHSFWVPQIISNVKRNFRKAYDKHYLFGISLTRLLIPLYFYGCPYNIMDYGTSYPTTITILTGYVAAQVAILYAQDKFGARFFVPEQWLPQSYNYHPILTTNDVEAPSSSVPPTNDPAI
ncbi:hypothetical protein HDV00_000278, partial [Rhizophlyctis rosea]